MWTSPRYHDAGQLAGSISSAAARSVRAGVEIFLVVLDDAREQENVGPRSERFGPGDVGARELQFFPDMPVPCTPVEPERDGVEPSIDDDRGGLDGFVRALEERQAHGAAKVRVFVRRLDGDRRVVVPERRTAIADDLMESPEEIRHRRRLREARMRFSQQLASVGRAGVPGNRFGDDEPGEEIGRLDESRHVDADLLQRVTVELPADARPESQERRSIDRRLDDSARRPCRLSPIRRVHTVNRQAEIQPDVFRQHPGLQPLQRRRRVAPELQMVALERRELHARRSLDVGRNRLRDDNVAFGFTARGQARNEAAGAFERLRGVESQLPLPDRNQEVRLEEPGDDEGTGAADPDALVNGPGFQKAVVAALKDEPLGVPEGNLVLFTDGSRRAANRHHDRRQPDPPHHSIGHRTPARVPNKPPLASVRGRFARSTEPSAGSTDLTMKC